MSESLPSSTSQRWLLYGHNGWLAGHLRRAIAESGLPIDLRFPTTRADDPDAVENELKTHFPDRVICFVGRTSGPGFSTIDYLEQKGKLVENMRDNLFSPLVLMKLCSDNEVHLSYLGTGCIFSYEKEDDAPFDTDASPNFFGSSYSVVKGFTDRIAKLFATDCLNVRIRMPISGNDEPGKSFLSKIIRYPKILSTLNSMTDIDSLFPLLVHEIWDRRTGTLHLVNPEPTTHRAILDAYREIVDPNHAFELVDESTHDSMLLAQRSKNTLVPSFPHAPSTIDAVRRVFVTGDWRPAEPNAKRTKKMNAFF